MSNVKLYARLYVLSQLLPVVKITGVRCGDLRLIKGWGAGRGPAIGMSANRATAWQSQASYWWGEKVKSARFKTLLFGATTTISEGLCNRIIALFAYRK